MDFEDNNPLGISGDELPRPRVLSPNAAPPAASDSTQERIVISEAGKSREGSSKGHITYTIRVPPGKSVRRRYSEFESLRKLLRRLFPCVVVPPIPEKHSLGAYAVNPTHAHEDARIIEHRQRTLANFVNRCMSIPQIRDSWALERFLDPNTSWRELMQSEMVLNLPRSPLQAPPVDPATATPAHAYLPIPGGSTSLVRKRSSRSFKSKPQDSPSSGQGTPEARSNKSSGNLGSPASNRSSASISSSSSTATVSSSSPVISLAASEQAAEEYERVIGSGLEKRARKIIRHYSALAAEYADLGGQFNSFSLDSHGQFDKFAPAVENVGQAVDQGYISTTNLVQRLSVEFSEPLAESVQMAATARQVLLYRRQREVQVDILNDALVKQRKQLEELKKAETEAQRINSYLKADDRISAATEGLSINASFSSNNDSDRDHVVDEEGIHDRDHEIVRSHESNHSNDSFSEHSGDNDDLQELDDGSLEETFGDKAANTAILNTESSANSAFATSHTSGNERKPSGTGLRRGFRLPGLSHINQAIHGMMDVEPQTSRRNNITRLQERLQQLEDALKAAEKDAEVAANEVAAEIERYNTSKRDDIRELVRSFINCHIDWAEKNLESWIEAKQAIANS